MADSTGGGIWNLKSVDSKSSYLFLIAGCPEEKMRPSLSRFGQRLRALRLAKGWSQETLALTCDLDRTYIGSIERGERNVSLINIQKIASALGVPVRELFLTARGLARSASRRPAVPRRLAAARLILRGEPRPGQRSLCRRERLRRRTVGRADDGSHRVTPPANVRAAHVTSPITTAAAGQGRVGQVSLFGLSLTSCHAPVRSLAGALDDQAVVGADDVDGSGAPPPAGVVDENRAAVDERRLHGFAEDLDDAATGGRRGRAGRGQVRRNLIRPVIRSSSTTAPPPAAVASSETPT